MLEPEGTDLARCAEEIYDRDYREEFERNHPGKFVLIEASTGHAFLGNTPRQALEIARGSAPRSLFHLIRVRTPAGHV